MTSVGQAIREMLQSGDVKITLERPQDNRSISQNSLMWLWHGVLAHHVLMCVGETYSPEEIHEYVANKLLPKRVLSVFGEPMIKRGETSKLGVKKFAEFLTHYENWALTEHQCELPQPDDIYYQATGLTR
jgi:hypothetical protein